MIRGWLDRFHGLLQSGSMSSDKPLADRLIFRAASVEDAGCLSDFCRPFLPDFNGSGMGAEDLDRLKRALSRSAILGRLAEGDIYWLAFDDSTLVGLLSVTTEAHIRKFFVAQQARGQGVGRALWIHAKGQPPISRLDYASLSALASQRPFYEKLGFRAVEDVTEEQGLKRVRMLVHLPEVSMDGSVEGVGQGQG